MELLNTHRHKTQEKIFLIYLQDKTFLIESYHQKTQNIYKHIIKNNLKNISLNNYE